MKMKDFIIVILIVVVGFLVYDKHNSKDVENKEFAIKNGKIQEVQKSNEDNKNKENLNDDVLLNEVLEENGFNDIKDEETKKEVKEAFEKVLEDDELKEQLKKSSLKLKDGKLNLEVDLKEVGKEVGKKLKNGAEVSADIVKELLEEEINKK